MLRCVCASRAGVLQVQVGSVGREAGRSKGNTCAGSVILLIHQMCFPRDPLAFTSFQAPPQSPASFPLAHHTLSTCQHTISTLLHTQFLLAQQLTTAEPSAALPTRDQPAGVAGGRAKGSGLAMIWCKGDSRQGGGDLVLLLWWWWWWRKRPGRRHGAHCGAWGNERGAPCSCARMHCLIGLGCGAIAHQEQQGSQVLCSER